MIWPFNLLAENMILKSRVHDLERSVEIMTGENQVLRQELERAKQKEDYYLDKIFDFVGLNAKTETKIRIENPQMFSLGKRSNWGQIKTKLEADAHDKAKEIKEKEEYWRNQISKTEKEILDAP